MTINLVDVQASNAMEIASPNYASQNFQFLDINDKELENVNKID